MATDENAKELPDFICAPSVAKSLLSGYATLS
jgi:hypothetical protein